MAKNHQQLYPLVSVDVALFSVLADELQVLLVQRANAPCRHEWALPGGVLKPAVDISLAAGARRVLSEKIDVVVPQLAQVATFSGPERDPRGWSIAALYFALLPQDQVQAVEKHKVERLEWASAWRPGRPLAFDHAEQLAAAVEAVKTKVETGGLPLHLLPREFTLTQLQHTCEAILRRPLDKSAFRRGIKGSPDLVGTGMMTEGGRQRPAQLYRARQGYVWR